MKFFDVPIVASEQQPRDRISLVRDEGSELTIAGSRITLTRHFREVGRIDLAEPTEGAEK